MNPVVDGEKLVVTDLLMKGSPVLGLATGRGSCPLPAKSARETLSTSGGSKGKLFQLGYNSLE